MGVSGSGKSTLGRALAQKLGWEFFDADDFHSAENIAKMAAGIPLSDSDRAPWLVALNGQLLSALQAEPSPDPGVFRAQGEVSRPAAGRHGKHCGHSSYRYL